MPKTIPDRSPIGDVFTGAAIGLKGYHALALSPVPEAEMVANGPLIVRYGVRYLEKPHLSIIPGLLVLDYGEMMTGEAAWEFLIRRSNLYPRSEVVGYRNDGRDDMVFIRQLDLAQPIEVLGYANASATAPIAYPKALIAADTANLPARLLDYLPCYASLAEWEATF